MNTAVIGLADNDAVEVGFEQLEYNVSENVGSVTLSVSLFGNVTVDEDISVDWGVDCDDDVTPERFCRFVMSVRRSNDSSG